MQLLDALQFSDGSFFNCADRLLWEYSDQILNENELAIAYPCLTCRGSLAIFLKYLSLSIETTSPGNPIPPVLIYPATPEIREAYLSLKIRISDLEIILRERRIKSHAAGGGSLLFPWEEIIAKRIRNNKLSASDFCWMYDFFPAAFLTQDGQLLVASREGFGRNDASYPSLHLCNRIQNVPSSMRYEAALIMHDAMEGRTESERVFAGLKRIKANCFVHLFESPYSPDLRRLVKSGVKFWRIKQEDFPPGGDLFFSDDELLRVYEAQRRIVTVSSLLKTAELDILGHNFSTFGNLFRDDNAKIRILPSRIIGLYKLITTLPVPIQDYDSILDEFGYSSLSEKINELEDEAEMLGPGTAYALVDETLRMFRTVLDRLIQNSERSQLLLIEVKKAKQNAKRIGIVIQGAVSQLAVEYYLSRMLNCERLDLLSQKINVVNPRTLRSADPFDVLIFVAYKGGRALRWMMSGRASEIVILATEDEQAEMRKEIEDAKHQSDSWTPNRNERSMVRVIDVEPDELIRQKLNSQSTLPFFSFDESFLLRDLADFTTPRRSDSGNQQNTLQLCTKISFEPQFVYLLPDSYITVLARNGTSEKLVKELNVDDVVIFVNSEQSKTIYELMLEEIRKSPTFASAVEIVQAWQRRLRSGYLNSKMSVAEIHRKIKYLGSTVVVGTAASWMRGNIMSPRDIENLKRLFSVLEIPNPDGLYSSKVDEAARKLRIVYRHYAKAVNAFLVRAANDERTEVQLLLEKHGLDIETVRDAVLLRKVAEKSEKTIEVPSTLIGRLYDF